MPEHRKALLETIASQKGEEKEVDVLIDLLKAKAIGEKDIRVLKPKDLGRDWGVLAAEIRLLQLDGWERLTLICLEKYKQYRKST